MSKIKILFLAANPQSTTPLGLDEEIRAITQKIRSADYRDYLELVSAWAVRPDDLLQYLNEHKPHIVHFSGHGSTKGEIVLVDNQQRSKPVNTSALKALFSTLKDNIQIVVLNACYSRLQAEAIMEEIDYVIGMSDVIGDEAAIIFAASFYRAIGFNRTVQEAFDQARTALLLEGIPEENTPELLVSSGVNPSKKLVEQSSDVTAQRLITLDDHERERQHKLGLLTQYKKRLQKAEIARSKLGFASPTTAWDSEIEECNSQIKKLERELFG